MTEHELTIVWKIRESEIFDNIERKTSQKDKNQQKDSPCVT